MTDIYTINTPGGVLDLRTCEFTPREHGIDDKTAAVDYYPEARCPEWEAFVDRRMGGDPERVQALRMAIGYTLTGSTKLQKMFVCCGGVGKTTLISMLHVLLGGYAEFSLPDDALRPNPSLPADKRLSEVERWNLRGARMTHIDMPDAGHRKWKRGDISSAAVKYLVSGEPMVGRLRYQESIVFEPTFKLWATAREFPDMRDGPVGLSRRVEVIPFEDMRPKDRDPVLLQRLLLREDYGIFAWAVRAASEWIGS